MTDYTANRLTLVPAIGIYNGTDAFTQRAGRVGVTASNITCAPSPQPGERAFGQWNASAATLELTCADDGRGPRSDEPADYTSRNAADGRQKVVITDTALLGAVEGGTIWGASGNKRAGQLLVWKWDLRDIDRIYVGRLKKYFKMWDGELSVECNNPAARFHYTGYGTDAPVFSSGDSLARAARDDGSAALGFARALATAAAAARGVDFVHQCDVDGKDTEDTFTFPSS